GRTCRAAATSPPWSSPNCSLTMYGRFSKPFAERQPVRLPNARLRFVHPGGCDFADPTLIHSHPSALPRFTSRTRCDRGRFARFQERVLCVKRASEASGVHVTVVPIPSAWQSWLEPSTELYRRSAATF